MASQIGQYSGLSLLDAYHILKNFGKNLAVKQHLSFFQQLIHAGISVEFKAIYKEADATIGNYYSAKFVYNAEKYCSCKIEPIFFLFYNDNFKERLQNLLKAVQSCAKEYVITIKLMLASLEKIGDPIETLKSDKTG